MATTKQVEYREAELIPKSNVRRRYNKEWQWINPT